MAPNDPLFRRYGMRKSLITLFLVSGMLGLTSCYQKMGVSLHSPGVYEGKHDPLLAKLKNPDWQKKLSERFKMSQSDR